MDLAKLVENGTHFSLRNRVTGRYLFVSEVKDNDGDSMVMSHEAFEERNKFKLCSAPNGAYQLWNTVKRQYVFRSEDREGGDNSAQAHSYEEPKNYFAFRKMQTTCKHDYEILSCGTGESLFDSNTTDDEDHLIEFHKSSESRNAFSIVIDPELAPVQNGANWMGDNWSTLENRTLLQVCMPGSHDSGMSQFGACTVGATRGNTVTQAVPILAQLQLGIRYFDIRPVLSGGNFLTGHYGSVVDHVCLGANGQSIESIVNEINAFTDAHPKELIILRVSHDLNTDTGFGNYRSFDMDEWDRLLHFLHSKVKRLARNLPANAFRDKTLDDFIQNEMRVIVLGDDDLRNIYSSRQVEDLKMKGMHLIGECVDIYDKYSDSNSPSSLANDQIGKMHKESARDKLFVLSWTLTMQASDFNPFNPHARNIQQLAHLVNPALPSWLLPSCHSRCYPNVISVDFVGSHHNLAMLAMMVNRMISVKRCVYSLDDIAGKKIVLTSWKNDHLCRLDDAPGVIAKVGDYIDTVWTVEVVDVENMSVRLRSHAGDYLHLQDKPRCVTTWETGVWYAEFHQGMLRLRSWNRDYLHRPDDESTVTAYEYGAKDWEVDVLGD